MHVLFVKILQVLQLWYVHFSVHFWSIYTSVTEQNWKWIYYEVKFKICLNKSLKDAGLLDSLAGVVLLSMKVLWWKSLKSTAPGSLGEVLRCHLYQGALWWDKVSGSCALAHVIRFRVRQVRHGRASAGSAPVLYLKFWYCVHHDVCRAFILNIFLEILHWSIILLSLVLVYT